MSEPRTTINLPSHVCGDGRERIGEQASCEFCGTPLALAPLLTMHETAYAVAKAPAMPGTAWNIITALREECDAQRVALAKARDAHIRIAVDLTRRLANSTEVTRSCDSCNGTGWLSHRDDHVPCGCVIGQRRAASACPYGCQCEKHYRNEP